MSLPQAEIKSPNKCLCCTSSSLVLTSLWMQMKKYKFLHLFMPYKFTWHLSHKLLPRNLSLAPRFPEAKGKSDFHHRSIFLSFQVIPSVHLIPCRQLRQAFVSDQKILHKRTFCFILRSKSPLFYNILHVACTLWSKADKIPVLLVRANQYGGSTVYMASDNLFF